ncbi:LysR family transcriptional regulator [soil metagenome]
MDRLAPLNAFVQAAEQRSFSAAGRELGISASAIGKAVSRLEARLGVRLFHRSTRSITLTPEGELFLKRCQSIFAEIDAAEQELADTGTTPRGRLRVSLPMIGMLTMPVVAAFAAAYPDITLELDFSDRLVDVIEEGFDAVVRTGHIGDSRLKMRTVGTYSYVIVASPAYLKTRGTPQLPEDLLDHACLLHRWAASGKLERWALSRDGVDLDLALPATMVASTMEPLINLAEHGLGLMFTPIFTVRRQLADASLVPVLDPYLRSTSTLNIVWPESRQKSAKVKAFVAFMAEHLLLTP